MKTQNELLDNMVESARRLGFSHWLENQLERARSCIRDGELIKAETLIAQAIHVVKEIAVE